MPTLTQDDDAQFMIVQGSLVDKPNEPKITQFYKLLSFIRMKMEKYICQLDTQLT